MHFHHAIQVLKDYPVIALHNRYLRLDTFEKPPQSMDNGVYFPVGARAV
ncbi:hypothetical protein ACFL0D_09195 [Thermoproteota archaeon]